MSTAGSIQPLGGGAPAPDPAHVYAIQSTMTNDAEAGAAFAEGPRSGLAMLIEQGMIASRAAPYAEAATLLAHVRDRVAGLDPAQLEPRGGLAGLFDSRGKRLRAFREAFASVADAGAAASADLQERAITIERRGTNLETVWTNIRDTVNDLDAHIAAARNRLSQGPALPLAEDPIPPEAAAAFEDPQTADTTPGPHPGSEDGTVEREADVEATAPITETPPPSGPQAVAHSELSPDADDPTPTPMAALPHPLEARLETLVALRASGVARLPLIRAAQNADRGVPEAIASARNAIDTWAADTSEALGLAGKRPRKVRPDLGRLTAGRDALIAHLSTAETVLTVAKARLSELDARVVPPAAEARIAA